MKRALTTVLVAIIAMPLVGCGGSNTTGGYGGTTPEAAFSNFTSAMKNKDYTTAFGQTTPETQETLIAGLALFAPIMAAMDPEKGATKVQDFQRILDKHAVKTTLDPTKIDPSQGPKAALKEIAGNVRDKPACVGEIFAWMESNASNGAKTPSDGLEDFGSATLANVKVEGDTATGTLRTSKGDKPAAFKKIGGLWFLEITDLVPGGPG